MLPFVADLWFGKVNHAVLNIWVSINSNTTILVFYVMVFRHAHGYCRKNTDATEEYNIMNSLILLLMFKM